MKITIERDKEKITYEWGYEDVSLESLLDVFKALLIGVGYTWLEDKEIDIKENDNGTRKNTK